MNGKPVEGETGTAGPVMQRLTGLDGISLHGETAVMPTHVMAVLFCDSNPLGDLTAGAIARTLAEHASATSRFRQRLLNTPLGLGQPSWVEDPEFDIARHLHRVRLPAPGTMNDLALFVGQLHEQRLARDRPLWEAWVVQGLNGGRVVVVIKFAHAMSDGVGAVTTLLPRLVGAVPDHQHRAAAEDKHARMPAAPARVRDFVDEVTANAAAAVRIARRATPGAVESAVAGLRRGIRGRLAAEASQDGALDQDGAAPRTRLNDPLTPRRSVAFAEVAMEDVRTIAETFRVTVNDVFLTAATSALREWLDTYDTVPAQPLRTFMPISTRSADDVASNSWSPTLVRLPVHLDDPLDQLADIHAATSRLKAQRREVPPVNLGDVIDLAPPIVIGLAAGLYTGLKLSRLHAPLAHLVTSNVPGPPNEFRCAGARVLRSFPLAPLCEGANLNLTAVSYNGKFAVGLVACPDNVDDVGSMARGFEAAVVQLRMTAHQKARHQRAPSEAARCFDRQVAVG